MEVKERFWSMVKRDGPDSCWEWQGYHLKDGYGAFHFNGKRVIASRFAWILTYGEIPPGMCVLHKCDNPSCVNPRHLFLGTQKDNMQDAVLKWRKSGPHNGRTKLSWPQVDTIRLLFQMGWSTRRVAKLFGVNHKTIWQIRAGKTWKEPAQVMSSGVPEGGNLEVMGPEVEVLAQGMDEVEEAFEVALFRAGKEKRGEAEESFLKAPEKTQGVFSGKNKKEEFFMKAKGMWFVTERVETPALTLEFPVGFFRSREAALAFVKGKEKSYRMRFIQSDLGEEAPSGNLEEADYLKVAEASSGSLGEAEENFQRNPEKASIVCSGSSEERAPEKT
ncbi:MAG: HNH endonuclease signature motif containing protein, partial [bacterium]